MIGAVVFDETGPTVLWSTGFETGGPRPWVKLVLVTNIRFARPEFFTDFTGTNELQDGLEVPPNGVLVF